MAGFTINTVVLSGNLTADPELRSTPSGTSLCKLRLAVNERYKNSATSEWEDRANFFDVTVWGGLGDAVARSCGKGSRVVVQGRLHWHEWSTDDGKKRSAVDVVAESVITPPKADNGGGGFAPRADVPVDTGSYAGAGAAAPAGGYAGAGGGASDDDIPF